MSEAKRH